jgi:dipeptidyl aminopeptidase/acylaminoacyl peptidase
VVRGSESNVTSPGASREPAFSPDSAWIAFIKDGEIRKAAVSGGPPVTLAPARNVSSLSWADDGSLIIGSQGSIVRIREGETASETLVDGLKGRVQSVQLLSAERLLLFTLLPFGTIAPAASEIIARSLDGDRQQTVARGGVEALYVRTGHLVYFSGGSLLAVPFDPRSLAISGTPVPVADSVASVSSPGVAVGAAHVAVSQSGTLAYVTGDVSASNMRSLVWVDRQGKEEPVGLPDQPMVSPRLSPDERHIAFINRNEVSGDVWVADLSRKTTRPLTTASTEERYATWTPDSKRIAFGSNTRGVEAAAWWQAADGSGKPEKLAGFPVKRFGNFVPTSVSPDGSLFIASATGAATGADLWLLPTSGKSPEPLLETEAVERNGEISPNGRFLAYESVENDQSDVFVRPFPNIHGGVWRVSDSGGSQPVWSRDGKELFFLDGSQLLTSRSVDEGMTFSAGAAKTILSRAYVWLVPTYAGRQYDVSRDGKRFLMMKDAGGMRGDPEHVIAIVQNWFEELRPR